MKSSPVIKEVEDLFPAVVACESGLFWPAVSRDCVLSLFSCQRSICAVTELTGLRSLLLAALSALLLRSRSVYADCDVLNVPPTVDEAVLLTLACAGVCLVSSMSTNCSVVQSLGKAVTPPFRTVKRRQSGQAKRWRDFFLLLVMHCAQKAC